MSELLLCSRHRSFLTLPALGTRVLQKATRGRAEGTLTPQQSFSGHLGVLVKLWMLRSVGFGSREVLLLGQKQRRGAEGDSSGAWHGLGLQQSWVRMKSCPAAAQALRLLHKFLVNW